MYEIRSGKIDAPTENYLASPLVKLEGWIGLPEPESEQYLEINGIRVDHGIKRIDRNGLVSPENGPFLTGWSKWIDLTQFVQPSQRGVNIRLYSDGVCVSERPYRLPHRPGMEASEPIYYFMHMPKTGGTTVREKAIEEIPATNRLYLYENDPYYLSSAEFAELSDEALREVELIYGHFDWGVHRDKSRPARYFTILRDPYDHFLSMYTYHRQIIGTPDVLTFRSIFDLMEECTNPAFDNFYCRSMCGGLPHDRRVNESDFKQALATIDRDFAFVGLTEQLQDSLSQMTRISGLPINQGQDRLNVGGITNERLHLDVLRYRQTVWPRIQYDLALYEYAKDKFWGGRKDAEA